MKPCKYEAARAMCRIGYLDGLAGRPMALNWHRGGLISHRYGMGWFHGRAHR